MDAVSLMVQVHDPYTYFGRLPLRLSPTAGPGLTVLAIESLAMVRALRVLARTTTSRDLAEVTGV
nr:hypothetical protein [Actinomycetota bacterium]NIW33236.1 hypothetical protein [Actinomycetota bacterium]